MYKILVGVLIFLVGLFLSCSKNEASNTDPNKPLRIVLLVKNLGNGFFEAVNNGGKEAEAELENVKSIYVGPSSPTVQGQIEIIEALISQKVDGIAISANGIDELIPIIKRAIKLGIKVISFDSNMNLGDLIIDLQASDEELIGRQQVKLIAELCDFRGKVAIVSSTPQAINQTIWINWMKEELKDPRYSEMELVDIVYSDDSMDMSYSGAMRLMSKYPDLAGIIAPTTVGILASAKAIQDRGMHGRVQLTGLGLPSEMQHYIENGVCGQMALWNPIDLGYTSIMILESLIRGRSKGVEGDVIYVGRMGGIQIGKNRLAVMGSPFIFNASNVGEYAKMF